MKVTLHKETLYKSNTDSLMMVIETAMLLSDMIIKHIMTTVLSNNQFQHSSLPSLEQELLLLSTRLFASKLRGRCLLPNTGGCMGDPQGTSQVHQDKDREECKQLIRSLAIFPASSH